MADIVAASELIVYISYPILWLNGDLAELRTAKVAGQKLKTLLDEPEDFGGAEELPQQSGTISVQDLSFSYGDRIILSHITCQFERGKKYLVIGTSGSGKSTLLNLIAGLRNDYAGTISLNGVEIRQLSRFSLTQNICAINQEPFLFDNTLYNNVALYEKIDEENVMKAIERVELSGFVHSLPNGIHTPLGENASTMSGGEKQRVVIARALVRHTPVLLLDESTSHLDPATASNIERLVLGLENVTVLLVSHNATEAAKKYSDEVMEMREGTLTKAIV